MLYPYNCVDCNNEDIFEFSMKDDNIDQKCSVCGGVSKRAFGATIHFKCGGFSKSRVDTSQARKMTTKVAVNQKALEQQREATANGMIKRV